MGLGMPIAWTCGVLAAKDVLPIISVAQANKTDFFTMFFMTYTSVIAKK